MNSFLRNNFLNNGKEKALAFPSSITNTQQLLLRGRVGDS